MRTKKPIATISYLSEAFLIQTLDKYIDNQSIIFWCFIHHKADEDLKKAHTHVYVEPAKTLDTVFFNQSFIEPVAGNLPLKALEWRYGKFDDWYMYSLHDSNYLAFKGQSRKWHYNADEFHCSDFDELDLRVSQIDFSSFVNLDRLIQYAVSQVPLHQAIAEGVIPTSQLGKYVNLYRSIKSDSWSRPLSLDEKYKHGG